MISGYRYIKVTKLHVQWKTAVSRYRPLFLLATSILLASRHKGMRQLGVCHGNVLDLLPVLSMSDSGSLAGRGIAGMLGQLERATVNDYCSGGQQVDRKMSIHERGCKGDSTNL